jgi:hypothetical protein
MVRHCDHCNKKVYFCETDEQFKFYTSVKFCIAVAQPAGRLNVEGNTPSSLASVSYPVESTAQHDEAITGKSSSFVPNVWRRLPSPGLHVVQHDERASSSQMPRLSDDSDIPAFLRKRGK